MRVLVTGRGGGVLIAGGDAFPTRRSSDLDRGDGDADGAGGGRGGGGRAAVGGGGGDVEGEALRLEEHTSELQSRRDLVQRVAADIVERAGGERGAGGHAGDGDGNDRVGIDLRQ